MQIVDEISFVVKGQPHGKGRPRHTKNGHVYTDPKTRAYENEIWVACKGAIWGRKPFAHAVEVEVHAEVKTPSSASKKAENAMLCGMVLPETKPDIDNVVKAVLDGCNGVAFADDKQVVKLTAWKEYSAEPKVTVRIREIAPMAEQQNKEDE